MANVLMNIEKNLGIELAKETDLKGDLVVPVLTFRACCIRLC